MADKNIGVVGAPCGQHGTYTFYKAFSYSCGGKRRVLALGEFFFVKLWHDQDIVCIGELQLLYQDKNNGQLLGCIRLYFLPENTPDGRLEYHGQDEVLAIQEKLTVRLEDLRAVLVRGMRWQAGWQGGQAHNSSAPPAAFCSTFTNSRLDLDDVEKFKRTIGDTVDPDEPCALVLSYDHYCRFRGLMKRFENVSSRVYLHALVRALGGFQVPSRNTRILYCRDVFEYPDLEVLDLFCNHLAPKLRGRSRKKAIRRGSSPSSESTSDTESVQIERVHTTAMRRPMLSNGLGHKMAVPGLTPNYRRHQYLQQPSPHGRQQKQKSSKHQLKSGRWSEKEFVHRLYQFMNSRGTPITKLPNWGLKPVNLYRFYQRVQEAGGYQMVCARRLWRQIFHSLGGSGQNDTVAASFTRRCYERLCLPFERFDRGLAGVVAGGTQVRSQDGGDLSALAALAESRPSITITPLPRSPAPAADYTALQRLASMARQTDASRRQQQQQQRQRPAPAHSGTPRRPPGTPAEIEVIDLTTGVAAHRPALARAKPGRVQPSLSITPAPPAHASSAHPTRIGSITITPVEKGSGAGASSSPAADQLLALRVASAQLQQMAMYQAGGTGSTATSGTSGPTKLVSGLEQLQRLQQQMALQSLMAQRMALPGMGLSPEQAQANLEAYQRMLQGGFHQS